VGGREVDVRASWRKYRGLSFNQQSVIALTIVSIVTGIASLLVAIVAAWIASDSTDLKSAVGRLKDLAEQAQLQTETLGNQVEVLSGQITEQTKQSRSLSQQADAAGRQAHAGQLAVQVAQQQLAVSERAFLDSKRQASAEALYSVRLDAMKTYVQGQAAYETAIYEVRDKMPYDIEEPERVNRLTMAELRQLREAVAPIIAANLAYQATFRSTVAVWPRPIRELFSDASIHAGKIGHCYEQASTLALTEEEAALVRLRLNTNCRNLRIESIQWEDADRVLYRAMANEVYLAAQKMGANPETAAGPVDRLIE
jgi:hypothetical protein